MLKKNSTELNLSGFKKGNNAIGELEQAKQKKLKKQLDNIYSLIDKLYDLESLINNIDKIDDELKEVIISKFNEEAKNSKEYEDSIEFKVYGNDLDMSGLKDKTILSIKNLIKDSPLKFDEIKLSQEYLTLIVDMKLDLNELYKAGNDWYGIGNDLELADEIMTGIKSKEKENLEFFQTNDYTIILTFSYKFRNIISNKIRRLAVGLFASKGIKSKAYPDNPIKIIVLKAINE